VEVARGTPSLPYIVAGFPEKFLIESSSRAGTTSGRRSRRGLASNSKKAFEKIPRAGRRRNWKKAYVCLKPGHEINFAQEA